MFAVIMASGIVITGINCNVNYGYKIKVARLWLQELYLYRN